MNQLMRKREMKEMNKNDHIMRHEADKHLTRSSEVLFLDPVFFIILYLFSEKRSTKKGNRASHSGRIIKII